jgi:penicillin V acylase-like amidase (Ntn superfamily)
MSIFACSGFYINRGNKILAGNNEDYINPNTKMWIIPSEKGKYGKIFFGFDDYFPQGGINEKGLFFDLFSTNPKKVLKSAKKPKYIKDNLQDEILSTCATVDDVIKFLDKYNLEFLENSMAFLGDSKGNSIIIEGDSIIRKNGDFQIITNFRQSEKTNITCERYNKMYEMLSKDHEISIDYSKKILDAVHVEGLNSNISTLYSQVYDIKNLIIYVYNSHDFNNCLKIDLKEELKKGLKYYDLPSLFPKYPKFKIFK